MALDLVEGSTEWQDFFDLAAASLGQFPKDLLDDKEVVEKLPLLFRTLRGGPRCLPTSWKHWSRKSAGENLMNQQQVKKYTFRDLRGVAEKFLDERHPSGGLPVPIEDIVEFEFELNIVPMPGLLSQFDVDAYVTSDMTEIVVDRFIHETVLRAVQEVPGARTITPTCPRRLLPQDEGQKRGRVEEGPRRLGGE